MSQRTSRRGQTLALFALTLLLLTVMVTMTLSFGTKAKERMELQQVADQAAYSTAVAVSRGMNVLAMTNRVAIAHYVAMLGLHSSSSFATLSLPILAGQLAYYAVDMIAQAAYCLSVTMSWCGCPGEAGLIAREIMAMAEQTRITTTIMALDAAVASSARGAGLAAIWLYAGQIETMWVHMWGRALDGQRMAERVMNASTSGPEWRAIGGVSQVAEREVGKLPFVDGALNVTNFIFSDRHAVMAAMASRGSPWTAGRLNPLSQAPMILNAWATRVMGGDPLPIVIDGSAYFGSYFHTNVLWSTSSTAAVADDHAIWLAKYIGLQCFVPPVPLVAVSFTYSQIGMSAHAAGLGIVIPLPAPPTGGPYVVVLVPVYGDAVHGQAGACLLNCPSSWTNFVDYNLLKVAFPGDNFAQPKLPVTLTRDMTRRTSPDPWNLLFNFRFNSGQRIDLRDNNGIRLSDGTDISLQTAMSTGISYYHRQGHWREPPNLLNPFWRAGITRADIDDQSRGLTGDIPRVLNDSNVPWAVDAYRELYLAGFRGLQ